MITESFVTDAQLLAAFNSGPVKIDPAGAAIRAAESLRNVAEMAIAAYIDSTLPGKLEQLDRVTAAVERFTGEVLT